MRTIGLCPTQPWGSCASALFGIFFRNKFYLLSLGNKKAESKDLFLKEETIQKKKTKNMPTRAPIKMELLYLQSSE